MRWRSGENYPVRIWFIPEPESSDLSARRCRAEEARPTGDAGGNIALKLRLLGSITSAGIEIRATGRNFPVLMLRLLTHPNTASSSGMIPHRASMPQYRPQLAFRKGSLVSCDPIAVTVTRIPVPSVAGMIAPAGAIGLRKKKRDPHRPSARHARPAGPPYPGERPR
jgi:hypothetical protein